MRVATKGESMRRLKRMFFAAGLSAVAAFALAGPAAAQNNPVKIDYTGTSKKGTLLIALGPQAADPPFKTNNVQVRLSSGITVNTGFVPDCTPAQLEGLEPAGALAACGPQAGKKRNALIATGNATAVIGSGAQAVSLPANAMAFAGPGSDVIVYARVEALGVTQIIPCNLGSAPAPYKNSFNCAVPPLAGGAGALKEFNLTFDRSETVKKKKKNGKKKKKKFSVVKGSCPAGGFVSEVAFTYDDAPPETNQYTDPC
jgi:hypothetical protein